MSEAFVDLSYRGLSLGRRIKLTNVQASSGYLETPAPMPVGTAIAIATDDGITVEAIVTHVHEQVGGATAAPGMQVAPTLAGDAAAWWSARVEAAQIEAAKAEPAKVEAPKAEAPKAEAPPAVQPPTAPPPAAPVATQDIATAPMQMQRPDRVTVRPRNHTLPSPPPEGAIADASEWQQDLGKAAAAVASAIAPKSAPAVVHPSNDHGATTVMQAVDPAIIEAASRDSGQIAAATVETTGPHAVVDDGLRTTVMAAVDPAALGLDVTDSGSMAAATDDTTDVGSAPVPDGKKPAGGRKKRTKRKG